MSQVTQILQAVEQGDAKAAGELLPLVYEELRQLAARKMASERPGHTLQPTALVHEAWLRLVGDEASKFNRGHMSHPNYPNYPASQVAVLSDCGEACYRGSSTFSIERTAT